MPNDNIALKHDDCAAMIQTLEAIKLAIDGGRVDKLLLFGGPSPSDSLASIVNFLKEKMK